MVYVIQYAGVCFTGLVRKNNEDNIFLNGTYLPEDHGGTEEILKGEVLSSEYPVLGVFDGMGGLAAGEKASFLAVKRLGLQKQRKKGFRMAGREQSFLKDSFYGMNQDILDFARQRGICDMGSTAAMAVFGRNSVWTANLGDSSIYSMTGGRMNKISRDHVMAIPGMVKAPLTQYLGMREEEGIPEAFLRKCSYEIGMQFLLCTDGVTDMLSEREISAILEKQMSLTEKVRELKQIILKKGAFDNTSVVLAQVSERKRSGSWLWKMSDCRNPGRIG